MAAWARWHGWRDWRRIALVGVLTACAGAGCVLTSPRDYVRNGFKLGPEYRKPPAPLADGWIQSGDSHVHDQHVQDWWRVFQDPALDSLVSTAYRQNLNLRVLGTRVLQARAQQAIAAGNMFPQLQEMTGSYSRNAVSKTIANNPASIAQSIGPSLLAVGAPLPAFNPTFGNWFSQWGGGFNLSWELDFWGRFRRSIETANANLDASVENFDAAMVMLLADVATN
jgi:outer membrane protein TolC